VVAFACSQLRGAQLAPFCLLTFPSLCYVIAADVHRSHLSVCERQQFQQLACLTLLLQGAIIIVGVMALFDFEEFIYLFQINKFDWLVRLAAAVALLVAA
jgi:hypothetical protein